MVRPVHHILLADASAWLIQEINCWIQAFFWAGKDRASGGHYLIAWQRICQSLCYGGLGVKNLQLQAGAEPHSPTRMHRNTVSNFF
jgi:hypothetical protein